MPFSYYLGYEMRVVEGLNNKNPEKPKNPCMMDKEYWEYGWRDADEYLRKNHE